MKVIPKIISGGQAEEDRAAWTGLYRTISFAVAGVRTGGGRGLRDRSEISS
jgi:hypothetical protein